jgi:hypothetical protein
LEDLAPLAMRSRKLEVITLEVFAKRTCESVVIGLEQGVRQAHENLYSDWFGESCMESGFDGPELHFRYTLTRNAPIPRPE